MQCFMSNPSNLGGNMSTDFLRHHSSVMVRTDNPRVLKYKRPASNTVVANDDMLSVQKKEYAKRQGAPSGILMWESVTRLAPCAILEVGHPNFVEIK